MTQFRNSEDFVGEYVGVYDGRQASLTISRVKKTDTLQILFKDVDRNQKYEGLYSVPLRFGHSYARTYKPICKPT